MTLGDAAKLSSMAHWKLTGKDRIVKVVSPSGQMAIASYGTAMGYVTQEKYLYGKNSAQIEMLLGLRPGELSQLCSIYSISRLPTADEVEYKFSCAFPDGKTFDDAQAETMMQAREDFLDGANLYDRSMVPVTQYYPPGSAMVPQWKLTKPVPIGSKIADVTRQFVFPRANGSVKPYTPHNRGEIR